MNSLRTAFSSLAVGTSASVKGKGKACLRAIATSSAIAPSISSGRLPYSVVSSTSSALELLKTQPNHYVIASITGRTFLLSSNDIVTVPRLKDVQAGDVLELDRIHEVGSRDYTLRAQDPMHCRARGPAALMRCSNLTGTNSSMSAEADAARQMANSWATRLHPAGLAHVGATLSPETVQVRAVVLEHTKGAMERILKKKRRKGYKKTITHKQPYTRLRIERIVVAP